MRWGLGGDGFVESPCDSARASKPCCPVTPLYLQHKHTWIVAPWHGKILLVFPRLQTPLEYVAFIATLFTRNPLRGAISYLPRTPAEKSERSRASATCRAASRTHHPASPQYGHGSPGTLASKHPQAPPRCPPLARRPRSWR